MIDSSFPVLALPKAVPLHNSVGKRSQPLQQDRAHTDGDASGGTSDPDSRSSSPRAHGHRSSPLYQLLRQLKASQLHAQDHDPFQGLQHPVSPLHSPGSTCSTPTDHAGGQHPQHHHHRCVSMGGQTCSSSCSTSVSSGGGSHPALRTPCDHPRQQPLAPHQQQLQQQLGVGGRRRRRFSSPRTPEAAAAVAAAMPVSSGRGNISRAKKVLAEAVGAAQGAGAGACETGVLSPLLAMVCSCGSAADARSSASSDSQRTDGPTSDASGICDRRPDQQQEERQRKLLDCLDTLAYLAVDNANRHALLGLGAMRVLLERLTPGLEPREVQLAALRALVAVARCSKAELWSLPGASAVLRLVAGARGAPAAHTQALLAGVAQLAWSSSGGIGRRLLEPSLVPALAALLHPSANPGVVLTVLDLLRAAAHGASAGKLAGWQQVVFQLVPLLMPSHRAGAYDVLAAAVQLLLLLAEVLELRNAICAAGCVPPLLALLFEDEDTAAGLGPCAAGILSSLAHTRLGQERLCEEAALCVLLRLLSERQHAGGGGAPSAKGGVADVKLAVLYVLRCLVLAQPCVGPLLRMHSAVPLLRRLTADPCQDRELRADAAEVLAALGCPPVPAMHLQRLAPDGGRGSGCGAGGRAPSGTGRGAGSAAPLPPTATLCGQQRVVGGAPVPTVGLAECCK